MSGRTLCAVDQRVLWGDIQESGRDKSRYATGIFSPRLHLNVDEIAAKVEGVGSITPIAEARFEERVEIWREFVMLEQGMQ